MNTVDIAIRIIYGKQRLYCDQFRERTKNAEACLAALALLTGLTVEQLRDPHHPESIAVRGGQIDTYHSY